MPKRYEIVERFSAIEGGRFQRDIIDYTVWAYHGFALIRMISRIYLYSTGVAWAGKLFDYG